MFVPCGRYQMWRSFAGTTDALAQRPQAFFSSGEDGHLAKAIIHRRTRMPPGIRESNERPGLKPARRHILQNGTTKKMVDAISHCTIANSLIYSSVSDRAGADSRRPSSFFARTPSLSFSHAAFSRIMAFSDSTRPKPFFHASIDYHSGV